MGINRGYDRDLTRRRKDIVHAFNLYKQGSQCRLCGERHPACLMFYEPGSGIKVSITYARSNWHDGDEAFEKLDGCECYCSNCFAKKFERREHEERGFRAWIRDHKREQGCVQCYEDDPICLEFHHVNPLEKEVNIAQCNSKRKALEEMEKCEVLCLKCHDVIHWEEEKLVN